jgi:hypothetical protein
MCGAIMAAGALIGLGLTAVGIGQRYSGFGKTTPEGMTFYRFHDLDTALLFILVVLTATLLIGIGIAFLGLHFHHERRHHEHLRLQGTTKPPAHTPQISV